MIEFVHTETLRKLICSYCTAIARRIALLLKLFSRSIGIHNGKLDIAGHVRRRAYRRGRRGYGTFFRVAHYIRHITTANELEVDMGFGRGVLLWLLGVPIPIILLIALFWHH
jgi:hypothetical protein